MRPRLMCRTHQPIYTDSTLTHMLSVNIKSAALAKRKSRTRISLKVTLKHC